MNDSQHLQADCQALGSATEPYTRESSTDYLYVFLWCAAVEFMWDNVIESLERLKDSDDSAARGCILAHCMGLGKTLSVHVHLAVSLRLKAIK